MQRLFASFGTPLRPSPSLHLLSVEVGQVSETYPAN
jgi:hypothetical protein